MKPVRVLVANVFFAPFSYGGATVVAEEVARASVAQGGFQVTAVSMCSRDDLAPYTIIKTEVQGIENYVINLPQTRAPVEFFDNPKVAELLAELIDSLEPDLIHAHCIQEIGVGLFDVARSRGIPVVLSVHDFWWVCARQFMVRMDQTYCGQSPIKLSACKGCVPDFAGLTKRQSRLLRAAETAALVTYPSAFAMALCEGSGLAPGKGVVWENGVRLPGPHFFEQQAARRKTCKTLRFGFIGGPSQIKGWPVIRAAFAALERDDFQVTLVDGSPDGSWWRGQRFDDLPGTWEVQQRYEQHDMDRFYSEIDVLLFMSQWKETFGLAVREALARGIKVIQTDSGGSVEHPSIDRADLIPIGSSKDVLLGQIEDALRTGVANAEIPHVTSFEGQAAAFARLVDDVVKKQNRFRPDRQDQRSSA